MYYKLQPKNRITLGSTGNALVLLLMSNAILYVLLIFFKLFYFMTSTSNDASVNVAQYHREIFDYFTLSGTFSVFLHRPWTLLSYMFTHDSLLQLLSNLLWLAAFGFILQTLAANRKMIPLYLYGGFIGGIVFMISTNLIAGTAVHMNALVGATPAVIAVAAGATTLGPKYRLFPMLGGGIPLWVLFVIFMVINLSAATSAGLPLALSYVFSAALGFFIIRSYEKGRDYCEWMYNLVYRIDDIFNPDKKKGRKPQPTDKSQLFYKATKTPFKRTELITQERVDELLDKISVKGYKALSKEEKAYLKRAGQ
ncbi:MAG TPA: rhomboid family intramembrane serine protease [Arachidicoccus sp.]|nr:rhomboid family intramembrane serine protease [Arachidicoccus sp.]